MLEALYKPMAVVMEHPLLAFAIAGTFLLLFGTNALSRKGMNRLLLLPVCAWALYGLYEAFIMHPWMKRTIAPIRVDLLLIAPLLYLVTIAGVVWWFKGLRKTPDGTIGSARRVIPRPSRAVVIFGWLVAIWGGYGLLFGSFLPLETMLDIASQQPSGAWGRFWRAWIFLSYYASLLFSAGYLIGGIGTLRLKNWARMLIIWLMGLSFGWFAIGTCYRLFVITVGWPFMKVIGVGLLHGLPVIWYAILLWFFTRPSVKAQFQKQR